MQFASNDLSIQVLSRVLGQQMTAVGRGAEQHVVGRGADRAVQHRLKRLIAGITGLERQIVAVEQKPLGPTVQGFHDFGQIEQVVLVHFDQPQTLVGVLLKQGFDQRRFAGTTRAPQQDVVVRLTRQELANVQIQGSLLAVDPAQVRQAQSMGMPHRLQIAALAKPPPAKCSATFPIGDFRGQRQ